MKYARRRVTRIILVTCALLAIMTLMIFYALSHNDGATGAASVTNAATPAAVPPAPARRA
jgi:hypothetical protein